MEFLALGPLQVTRGSESMPVRAPYKMRLLLALLLSRAQQTASRHWLVDAIWSGRPPASARRNLHQYVHGLRVLLGPDVILTRPDGYAVMPERFDVAEFRRLATVGESALASGEFAQASTALGPALDLWRGPAYGEFADCAVLAEQAAQLDHERCTVLEQWAEAELALGHEFKLAGVLSDAVRAQPFRENLRGYLMLALYREGRQAEALQLFRDTRELLNEELGIEPGPQLQRLHTLILRGDSELPSLRRLAGVPNIAASTRLTATPIPRQMPADVAGFVGRDTVLKLLDELVPTDEGDPTRRPVVVSVITGGPGVGKTSLAVHWAHRVVDRFPDGQLYINLRGFGPDPAMDPAEAIRGFLDAFAVPPDGIPSGLDAQAALLRTLLAGKRVLVVLDNARNAEQVRPLLPGSPGCMVLITSRNQLPDLIASHAARLLSLDPLSTLEARELIARRVGVERVRAEADVVDEIIHRCAHLPLALAIVAARATIRNASPLQTLACELVDARNDLDHLSGNEVSTDVRAVFSWSYRSVGTEAARVFRLLGLHPGPDVSSAAVASLAAIELRQAVRLLAELTQGSLVSEHADGRYVLHDLLRVYAAELAHALDAEADREAAMRRMLDHYLQTAHRGALLLYPHRYAIALAAPVPGAEPIELANDDVAMRWFTTEHAVLLAAASHAAGVGYDEHAWQLAWAMQVYLDRRGHWPEDVALQSLGLVSARRIDQRAGQAHCHHGLGVAQTWMHRYDEAHANYQQSAQLFAEIGDVAGQAHTHLNWCNVFEQEGRCDEAYQHAKQALTLFEAAGHKSGQAKALNAVGWQHAMLGRPDQALPYCEQAIELLRELGDRYGEALTWDSLGYVHHLMGNYRRAADCYQRSIDLWQVLDDRHSQATVLHRLGECHHAAGQHSEAQAVQQRALNLLQGLDDIHARKIRHELLRLGRTTSVAGS